MTDTHNAYRYWRQRLDLPYSAAAALAKARADVGAGTARYPSEDFGPGRWGSAEHPKQYHLIDDTGEGAFRLVGTVVPESYGGENWRCTRQNDPMGWLTKHDGDIYKDGDGLCYGVVMQLPGRNGTTRFVAGYQYGGCDGGPSLDLSTIYEEPAGGSGGYRWEARELKTAREAARQADDMAREAAETEREYNTAWTAGTDWAELQDQIETNRKERRSLVREMRAACHVARTGYSSIRAALIGRGRELREESREAYDRQERLSRGEDYDLNFWAGDPYLASGFNEGAGRTVIQPKGSAD